MINFYIGGDQILSVRDVLKLPEEGDIIKLEKQKLEVIKVENLSFNGLEPKTNVYLRVI